MSVHNPIQAPWVPDSDSFGARLALIRREMRWNLKEAAVECGMPMNAWARYEAGMMPRDLVGVVRQICARTGVDRQWLLFGELPDLDSNQEPAGSSRDGGNVILFPSRRVPAIERPAAAVIQIGSRRGLGAERTAASA